MPETEEYPCWEQQLRKQLLLLATLVLSATYVAGMNLPGGVWQENGSGHKAGDTILLATNRRRYLSFYYCNSTALAASVIVIFLLLLKKPRWRLQLILLPVVMMLGLLGLLMLCIVASPTNPLYLLYPAVLVSTLLAYIGYQVWQRFSSHWWQEEEEEELDNQAPLKHKERRKVLMLLSSFTMVTTYVVGLSSWGSYQDEEDGLHQEAKARFRLFFNFNVTTFMASVFVVTLQCTTTGPFYRRWEPGIRSTALFASILAVLLGLLGAYAYWTDKNTHYNVYVWCLIEGFLTYISVLILTRCCHRSCSEAGAATTGGGEEQEQPLGSMVTQLGSNAIRRNEETRKVKSLLLLLATLAATVTYQAGLHPPGGVWTYDRAGHQAGSPILLSTQPSRYRVFIYCNSSALMLSLDTIFVLMVHKEKIINTTLLVLVILDVVSLMGAYVAGSWMDARSSIYILAMAGGVVVYLTTHVFCVILNPTDMDYRRPKKRHKRLVLVAILIATITYQSGLNPPGSFWRQDDDGHTAGVALLMENYPRRFWVFFYSNTTSFMASMAVILSFFVSPNLDRLGIRCYALFYACIVVAVIGLMAAYAATTVKLVQPHAFMILLLPIVVAIVGLRTIQSRAFLLKEEREEQADQAEDGAIFGRIPRTMSSRPRVRLRSAQDTKYRQVYASHKHEMLLGVLAASATYQAGLKPPGRLSSSYLAFNTTSFLASLFVLVLQLQKIVPWGHQPKYRNLLVNATNLALMLDMVCIVAAYLYVTAMYLEYTFAMVVLGLLCMTIMPYLGCPI